MRAEHLRQWLIAATRDNTPDATNWLMVVAIVQATYRDGTLAEECMQQTVVLTLMYHIAHSVSEQLTALY